MSNHSNSIQLCGVAAYAPPIVFPNLDNHNRHCAPELIPLFLDTKFTSARTHNTHKNVNAELFIQVFTIKLTQTHACFFCVSYI